MIAWEHSKITRFLLQLGLENEIPPGSKRDRANNLARVLINIPTHKDQKGRQLSTTAVEALVEAAIESCCDGGCFDQEVFWENYIEIGNTLHRDGFTLNNGELQKTMPEVLEIPEAADEVHDLLAKYGFSTSVGHLDQAIAAHTRGDWAAANAQLRAFTESLLDEIAGTLGRGDKSLPTQGHLRRQWLAQSSPPFFISTLNEWSGNGTGFFEAFYRRLHPHGSHPGLSDEEDSTFRLHLVLITARLLLRRLRAVNP